MKLVANQRWGGAAARLVGQIPGFFLNRHEHGGAELDRSEMYRHLIAHDLLRRDEARELDEAVVAVADRDRIGLQDLIDAGLTKPLRDIGVTIYQADRMSAVPEAQQTMSITDIGDRDQVAYTPELFPVPVTPSPFRLDSRTLSAGGTRGQGIDVTNAEEHTRACIRRMENTLVNGNSGIVLQGNTLQGYTNKTGRQAVTLGTAWPSLSNLEEAVSDVLSMRAALRDDGFDGPYMVYVSTAWESVLDDDYNANKGDRTLRERIRAIEGVIDCKVMPSLSGNQALMVQMTRSVVEYAIGQEITLVTWDLMGGLAQEWVAMEVSCVAIKTAEDNDGNATVGVAHLS